MRELIGTAAVLAALTGGCHVGTEVAYGIVIESTATSAALPSPMSSPTGAFAVCIEFDVPGFRSVHWVPEQRDP